MVEYVYTKPKKSHGKEIAVFLIVAVVAVVLLFQYEQIVSFLGGPLSHQECSNKISKLCTDCFMASRFAMEPSEFFENQSSVGEDVIECSNLYYDSNWTAGQKCSIYLKFCSSFLSEK